VSPRAQRADLKVFVSHSDSVCHECRTRLGRGAWIVLDGAAGALCLECADLDHLDFLKAGDASLTRRAKKHSRWCAVVLKFSRARRRYERQGLLIEPQALVKAEAECLADEALRRRRREREAVRREAMDKDYVARFAECIRTQYPGCPPGTEMTIAEHACRKHSGRVGRSAAAKELDERAVRLAVAAHIRHVQTSYDELLGSGCPRIDARRQIAAEVDRLLAVWAGNSESPGSRELFPGKP
jgi:hypothetical protein